MRIGPGTEHHLQAINLIYNHYVAVSHATFDVEPWSQAQREDWFSHYAESGRYRLLVAESAAEGVVGFATSSPFRPRRAYETSVETSIYLHPEHLAAGIGSDLYRILLSALEEEDVHRAYGCISLPNPGSVALHQKLGFRFVGTFGEQGRKFGRYWDVAWFERPVPHR